jgi:hypothetical protein
MKEENSAAPMDCVLVEVFAELLMLMIAGSVL